MTLCEVADAYDPRPASGPDRPVEDRAQAEQPEDKTGFVSGEAARDPQHHCDEIGTRIADRRSPFCRTGVESPELDGQGHGQDDGHRDGKDGTPALVRGRDATGCWQCRCCRDQEDDPDGSSVARYGVGRPGECRPRHPQHRKEEPGFGGARPGWVVDEMSYELAEREDKRQVEEQLNGVGREVFGRFRDVETAHSSTLPAARPCSSHPRSHISAHMGG